MGLDTLEMSISPNTPTKRWDSRMKRLDSKTQCTEYYSNKNETETSLWQLEKSEHGLLDVLLY